MPPGAIGVLGEGEGESPFGEEGGRVVLPCDAKEVKIRGREGTCEEMIGKGCNVGVICSAISIIRAAREGVGAIGGARFMDKDDIVIAERENVAGDTAVNMLGGAVILEVLMIGDDCDAVSGAHKEVVPVFETMNDSKEFPIPNWVVLFGLGEGF